MPTTDPEQDAGPYTSMPDDLVPTATTVLDVCPHPMMPEELAAELSWMHDAPRSILVSAEPLVASAAYSIQELTMPPQYQYLLPRGRDVSWSVSDFTLDGQPVSLSRLRRTMVEGAWYYSQHRTGHETVQEVLAHKPSPVPEFDDVAGNVATYRNWMEGPESVTLYNRKINLWNLSSPFPLEAWWARHVPSCTTCQHHAQQHENTIMALANNHQNECHYADILCWLSGGFRLPLRSTPSPDRRRNYASMGWAPAAVMHEFNQMLDWQTLRPIAHCPVLVHPVSIVIKDSDIANASRILSALNKPPPTERKEDIVTINAFIEEVLASGVPIPPELGELKAIKVRACFDTSILLNHHVKSPPFKCATIHDLARLLKRGAFMGGIDLERYYNQLTLSEEDAELIGVFLPHDLNDPHSKVGAFFKAVKAVFGVNCFPYYGATVSACISAILWLADIPNVFMTDDFRVIGDTEAECQARLDRAVEIMLSLGLRLQEIKILPPAQRMPFLGILVDSVAQRMALPIHKGANYSRVIDWVLEDHARCHLLVPTLERLVGQLGHACEVMLAGRAHLHRIRKCLPSSAPNAHKQRGGSASSVVALTPGAIEDLRWWQERLTADAHDKVWMPFWSSQPPVMCSIYSDASGDVGYGLVLGDRVVQGLWTPEARAKSSGYKELIPILHALELLGPEANGRVVIITTDNLSNVFAINKGRCKSEDSFPLLFRIMELAASRQIYLVADWVPREHNVFQDVISKYAWPPLSAM